MKTLRIVFTLIGLVVGDQGLAMSDVSSQILRAARFEDWNAIIKLAPRLELRDASDLPALVAVLDACAARRCKQNPPIALRGRWGSDALHDFAQAWIAFSTDNPARGRDGFRALTSRSQQGWLGMYGLLQYAMDTENVALLRATIEQSAPFEVHDKSIRESSADAKLLLAVLMHEYERLPGLLESIGQHASDEARFARQINYLVWRTDFPGAQKLIDSRIARFGRDYAAVRASIGLMDYQLPPDRVVAEIDRNLKLHSNYWGLLLARIALVEGDEEKADAFIAAEQKLPMNLSGLRLSRFHRLAYGGKRHIRAAAKELERYSTAYDDYPLFHVSAARIAKSAGKQSVAANHLDIALKQNAFHVDALSERGFWALDNGDTAEAVKYFVQVAKLNPNDVYMKLVLARAYLMAENYTDVRRVLAEVRSSKGYVPHDHVMALERDLDEAVSRPRR